MTIWIGTGGTPLSAKERSSLSGIERLHELGLNTMEIEFVYGVNMKEDLAEQIGELSKKHDIRLSIHAPYYINLTSVEKEKVESSKKRIIDSCEKGHSMGAKIVLFHPAYYGKMSPEKVYQMVKEECQNILDKLKEIGVDDILLGLETTGKRSQFGTIDECIRIVKEVKGCGICIDWAHIYARNGGKIDFKNIFDKFSEIKNKQKVLHSHFSCIKFSEKGERNHLTLDTKEPDYQGLVDEIKKRKVDITLISESPNLEVDALKLKEMLKD